MELKSPSIPLFQKGKLTSPPFGVFSLPEAGKGRQGGIFKALKYYLNPNINFISHLHFLVTHFTRKTQQEKKDKFTSLLFISPILLSFIF